MLYEVRCRSTAISVEMAGSALRMTSSVTGSRLASLTLASIDESLRSLLELQKLPRVATENLLLVVARQGHRVEPVDAGLVLHERPVHREEHPLDAHLHHRAGERGRREVA